MAPLTLIDALSLLLVLAMLVGLVGFVRTVWFISTGYAASMVTFAVSSGFLFAGTLTVLSVVQLLAVLVWGLRLGLFLVGRERNPAYQAAVKGQTARSQSLSVLARLGIWVSVSMLYVCMFSPAVFLTGAARSFSSLQTQLGLAGVALMWLGLCIESLADYQKSRAKAANPGAFVSGGLFSWVRYPNYLGEILFWTGNFIAGLAAYQYAWHWLLAALGLVCIVLIMMGSTKRMEHKQDQRYGSQQSYREYVASVPVLLPWVPVYTLRGIKVWLE